MSSKARVSRSDANRAAVMLSDFQSLHPERPNKVVRQIPDALLDASH
jgi:hypothetical protein